MEFDESVGLVLSAPLPSTPAIRSWDLSAVGHGFMAFFVMNKHFI